MKPVFAPFFMFLALLAPLPLRAQSEPPEAPIPAEELEIVPIQTVEGAPIAAVLRSDPLPGQTAPPRTLRAYWHLFIAFAVAWLLIFGYVLSLGIRFRRLDATLAARE